MTDEELKELVAGLARSQAKTDKALQDLVRTQEEGDKKTDELLQRVIEQLGDLGNRFGGFTEGMALPSVREILYDQLGVDAVVADARARRNGRSFQVDALGIANGDVGAVYLVEIKSRLREEGLQQILNHLGSFGEFFPEHRGKTRYGVLVAVDVPEALEKRVLQQGIYLAKIHGDLFELVLPEGFEPRGFPG
jgi:hypothetical protein